ncbi:B-cell receptor CD22-like [Paramisgurnus dabryanus]|uniref:B-cell receptor CD22-like n=1 Tax=Paramisgurnus dabryanus TaxID=90735 RepID=UPI0031F43BEE
MKTKEQIIIFICLLQGVWCGDWNISLPEKIEALSGSCVTINCTFTINNTYDTYLTDSAAGVWYKDGHEENNKIVFNSSNSNLLLKGKITGKLKHKDCTTNLYDVTSNHNGKFYFRIEGSGPLKYTYAQKSALINVTASPPNPTVKMFKDQMEVQVQEVLEGSSMCLRCSAKTLCSSSPPTLTWSSTDRLHLNESSRLQLDQQNQTEIISDLNFTATHLQHGVTFICTITYQIQQRITTAQNNITLRVQYAPKTTLVSVFPSKSVLEGSSVTLICSSDGNPAVFNYTWYRENGGLLEELQTGYNLTFNVTDRTHTGRYYCQAQNQHGTQNTSVLLDIQYAPKNTSVSVLSNSVLEGSSVTLICSSDGNPAVFNYTWYRENEGRLEELQTGYNLTFNVTDRTHTGRYYCKAKNQHGAQNTSVLLDIQHAPENTSVSVFPSNSVLEGSSVTLICNSDGNPAVFNYTWYRENGGELVELQTGYNLTFNVINRTHTGRYYCQTKNKHGTRNTSVSLDIQYAPKNTSVSVFPSNSVLEGSSVTLICSSDGNPAVFNYTWYRENGGQLEELQTGFNLTFNVTDRTHTGRYYCQAKNQHGTHNISVLLDIQYAPKTSSVSVFPSNSVLEGSSVTLICSSDGNPAVFNYTWYRENGGQLDELQTGYNLTFNVTDRTHTGHYYCQAKNQHGTVNASVLLDIHYPTKIYLFSCNRTNVTVCLCEAHGNPSPKVDWFLSGRPLSNSTNTFISEERLNSTDLRSFISLHQSLTHTDTLQCVTSNTHGTASELIQLVCSPHETTDFLSGFSLFSVLIGAAVGASVMMILCVITHLCKRNKNSRSSKTRREDTAGLILTDRENEEPVYANKAVLSPAKNTSMNYPQSLHYSSIDFTNTQTESEEIRGVSSLTAVYADVRHSGQEEARSFMGSIDPLPNSNISTVETADSKARDPQFTISTDTEQTQSKKTDLQSDEVSDLYAQVKYCHPKNKK